MQETATMARSKLLREPPPLDTRNNRGAACGAETLAIPLVFHVIVTVSALKKLLLASICSKLSSWNSRTDAAAPYNASRE